MRYFNLLSGICLIMMLGNGCAASDADPAPVANEKMITYEESIEDFVNPERGFYRYSETRSGNYQVLRESTLRRYRDAGTTGSARYQTYNSLVFRYFVLEDFTNTAISSDYLENIQRDFDVARAAGVKVIPRFTYTTSANSGDCSEGFICPPYGDAPKEFVLQHIGQIGPILTRNADVILTVQMGFIGTWGENYYTDFFGDPSSNADQGKILDENWLDRIEVLNALLDAIPTELTVQVRTPQMKQRTVYGVSATTMVAPLTSEEAYDGSRKSRIGFHNDCLFASPDDFGTYADYGNTATAPRTDVTNLKNYFAEDSRFVVVGGETCSDGYSPQNDCSPLGMADTDLRLLHYTYLNNDYNNEVNNDWVDGGCMESIKQNLGYRLVMDSVRVPKQVASGSSLELTLFLRNTGYAAPVSSRPVQIVLVNEETQKTYRFEFDTDIRQWFDQVTLQQSFDLPDGLTTGDYQMHLSLPDRSASISDRPEYAIRLANQGIWLEETGMNALNHTLEVTD